MKIYFTKNVNVRNEDLTLWFATNKPLKYDGNYHNTYFTLAIVEKIMNHFSKTPFSKFIKISDKDWILSESARVVLKFEETEDENFFILYCSGGIEI